MFSRIPLILRKRHLLYSTFVLFVLCLGLVPSAAFECGGVITLKIKRGDQYLYDTNEFRIAVEGKSWQLTIHKYISHWTNHVYATFGSTNNDVIYSLLYNSNSGQYSAGIESNQLAFKNFIIPEMLWRCLASPSFAGKYDEMLRQYKWRNPHGHDWSSYKITVQYFDQPSNMVKSALLYLPLGADLTNANILAERNIQPFRIPPTGMLTGIWFNTLAFTNLAGLEIPTHCIWINYRPEQSGAYIPKMVEHLMVDITVTNALSKTLIAQFIPEIPKTNVYINDRRLVKPLGQGERIGYYVNDGKLPPVSALPAIKKKQEQFTQSLGRKPKTASLILLSLVVFGPAIYLLVRKLLSKRT